MKYKLKIERDDDVEAPWEHSECNPTIIGVLRNYRLGPHDWYGKVDSKADGLARIKREFGPCEIREVYAYIHSGIALQIDNPAGMPDQQWDVSFAGWAIFPHQDIRAWYCKKYVTKKLKERANKELEGWVDVVGKYLQGDVHWWAIYDEDEDIVDSCGGYYDEDQCRIDGLNTLCGLLGVDKPHEDLETFTQACNALGELQCLRKNEADPECPFKAVHHELPSQMLQIYLHLSPQDALKALEDEYESELAGEAAVS